MSNNQKILYLVRHAKSSWKDSSLRDIDRPLNKRGQRSAPDMGLRMAAQNHRPDLIISSPANRALSTAKIIADQLGYAASDIIQNDKLYFAGTGQMQSVLQSVDDHYGKVMMVGHNPAMTWLLNELGSASVVNMPTCAIAVIGFDIDSWSDLPSAHGELLGYDFPKGAGDFNSYIYNI